MVKKVENFEDSSSCSILRKEFNKLVSDLFNKSSSTICWYKPIWYIKLAEKNKIEILFFFDAVTKKMGVFSDYRDNYSADDFDFEISTINFDNLLIIRPGLFISTTEVHLYPFDSKLKRKLNNDNFNPNTDFNFLIRDVTVVEDDDGFQHCCWQYNKLTSESELQAFIAEKILSKILTFDFDVPVSKHLISEDKLYNSLFGKKSILSRHFNYSRALYYFNKVKGDSCGRSNAIKMLTGSYLSGSNNKEDLTDPEDLVCQEIFSASDVANFEYRGMFAKHPKLVRPNSNCYENDYGYPTSSITQFLQSYFIELLKTSNTQLSTTSLKMLNTAEKIIKEKDNLPVYWGRKNYFGFVKIKMKTISYALSYFSYSLRKPYWW